MKVSKAILKKLPTIPQYYQQYVNKDVDLNETPYQPCPFHDETSGRSFSYSSQLGIWKCFGACHAGGDVVALHQINYRMTSKEEALNSLCSLYGVELDYTPDFTPQEYEIDERDVYRRRMLAFAQGIAKTTEDYVELDFIVSQVPYDVKDLELYCSKRGFILEQGVS